MELEGSMRALPLLLLFDVCIWPSNFPPLSRPMKMTKGKKEEEKRAFVFPFSPSLFIALDLGRGRYAAIHNSNTPAERMADAGNGEKEEMNEALSMGEREMGLQQ